VAREILGRIVFRRLPKGTGADYLMREDGEPNGDRYERLEVSGIGDGHETASARLSAKIDQLRRHDGPSGVAIVTRFTERPREVQVGGHRA